MRLTLTLPPSLATRLRASALATDQPLTARAVQLLTIALDHLDARRRGAEATNRGRTAAQRSASAVHAVAAREARRRARQHGNGR